MSSLESQILNFRAGPSSLPTDRAPLKPNVTYWCARVLSSTKPMHNKTRKVWKMGGAGEKPYFQIPITGAKSKFVGIKLQIKIQILRVTHYGSFLCFHQNSTGIPDC